MNKLKIKIKINDKAQYGNKIFIKSKRVICILEYKNKFCGFPSGVKMLPRFAPIVCITIMKAENFKLSVCFKIKIANGTNVIRATSFVINMLEKKQSKIKVKESVLRFFILLHNFFAQKEKTPRF